MFTSFSAVASSLIHSSRLVFTHIHSSHIHSREYSISSIYNPKKEVKLVNFYLEDILFHTKPHYLNLFDYLENNKIKIGIVTDYNLDVGRNFLEQLKIRPDQFSSSAFLNAKKNNCSSSNTILVSSDTTSLLQAKKNRIITVGYKLRSLNVNRSIYKTNIKTVNDPKQLTTSMAYIDYYISKLNVMENIIENKNYT